MPRPALPFAVVLGLLAARALAGLPEVLSPGPLSRAHRTVTGSAQCTECHPAGQPRSAQACRACHEELEPSLAADAGYHGRLEPRQLEDCHACHREHRGAKAALIDWGRGGRAGFDHAQTGFALEGAHAEVGCDDCHRAEFIARAEVKQLLVGQPGRKTHLGLSTRCASCHFDEHRGQEEDKDCDACHAPTHWRAAPRFDHDDPQAARFPLQGRHRQVACVECHPAKVDRATPGRAAFPAPLKSRYLTFRPLEFERCADCHEDAHEERLGEACDDCHALSGWTPVALETRAFHDKARFKLEGAHLEVECRACHGPGPGTKKTLHGLAFRRCADCHADAHLGQLPAVDGGPGPDCAQCHAATAFTPARYEEAAHRDAGFPLEASHRAVACSACHPRAPELAARITPAVRASLARQGRPERFSLTRLELPDAAKEPTRCDVCHEDVHDGQFKERKEGCRGCHEGSAFADLSFDHDAGSRFPLEGQHLEVACSACHPAETTRGRQVVRYRPLPMECERCHADEHVGQLTLPTGKTGPECKRCHTPKDFKPSRFKHEAPFTTFLLKGKHQDVKCEKCHPRVEVAPTVKTARYRPLPTDCEGCHQDQHRGDFGGYAP